MCVAVQKRGAKIGVKGGGQDCIACIKSYLLYTFIMQINREIDKYYMYYVQEPILKAKYEMGTYQKGYYYKMGML